MNSMMLRIAQVIVILALLASAFALGGCSNKENRNIAPAVPTSAALSFPQGAPRLNQTAELRCVVKTPALTADNVTVKINLPDGLELVSGALSAQFGTMSEGDMKELKAFIKPVKVGNYTIEAKLPLVSRRPTFHPGPGLHYIYLSVSEKSAQWDIYPPWLPKKVPPPPVTPAPPAEAPSAQ